MVDKNLDAFIEDVVHGALEDYVEKMSSRLTQYLLSGVDNPDMLSTLAARAKSDAMAIFTKYKGRISKETREAFLEAVESYEVEVEQALERLHPKHPLTGLGTLELTQAARGVGEVITRQNIALANTMATTWYTIAANAIVRRELGDSRRAIMEDAVRTLSDAGIETVDYKSGVKTTIDAAVRRHIVSQVSQAKAQILSDKCDEYDQDLVFVSAHFGARPSHAIWQGKVYSRSGTSSKYPSLDEGTGYSGTGPFGSLGDRLCGVNCQHEMVPYMPGLSQLPDLSFEKEQKRYGMTSEEYYKATQKQRALERKVRKYKRRIALGQEQGLDMVDDRYKLGRTQALLREHCRANGLTRLYERERAYGVKRQPRGLAIRRTYTAGAITTGDEFSKNNWIFSKEYGALLDKNGNIVGGVVAGGRTHVRFLLPKGYEWHNLSATHTHPSEYGGTFSVGGEKRGDIFHLTDANLMSYTAVCNEGIYRIERTENSKPKKFYKAAKKAEDSAERESRLIVADGLMAKGRTIFNGGVSYDELFRLERIKKAELMHEWFSQNAKIYGYRYSFTKSRK
ncbi:phage minor capsid protein [Atopobium minutum]|uniref:phage minor capsid protein n=1 Tax=Atopobium minutum TaxID=1381 RepID=UPI00280AD846|nr:phage minor capsid protein [Atopobium minutum]